MATAHRDLGHRLRELIRPTKQSAHSSGSKSARGTAAKTAVPTSKQPVDSGHPRELTENEEHPGITASDTCLSVTQPHAFTNEDSRTAADLGTGSIVDKLSKDEATRAAAGGLEAGLPMRLEKSQILPRDNQSPIWFKSVERFQEENPKGYKLMMLQLNAIQNLKDEETWETWLNHQDLDKTAIVTTDKWLRRCKAYVPSFATLRILALGLSNLDPHKVAPLITAGVFVLIELCFGLMDPATREKAMGLLLKTNIVINKWASREGELRRMKMTSEQKVGRKVERIEEGLVKLYIDSLALMSKIYGAGRSRTGRFKASTISEFPEWDLEYQDIQNRDSVYGELKGQVELMLKDSKENVEVLEWIRNRKVDPEPLHQAIKERTGLDDPRSTSGSWFMETPDFSSWIDGIHNNTPGKQVFWLKGSMGTGKTTLLCRAISQFDEFPIQGVKFVHYYCSGSGPSPGPNYETIIRALCRRLAWNSDGTVSERAAALYKSFILDKDAQVTVKNTWEPLLRDLVTSSSTTIVFVLDALDECKGLGDYKDLLEFLTNLPSGPQGPFLLVSSQPHVPVGEYFDASVQTFSVVQPETMDEMKNFVDNQIAIKRKAIHCKKSIFFKHDDLLEELRSALLDSAGGMFRWVEIWLGVFFPKSTRNAVKRRVNARHRLNDLKTFSNLAVLSDHESDESRDDKKKMALKDAYDKLWEFNGGHGDDTDLQRRLFQIVTASFENLTPQALLEAVCFAPHEPPKYYEELESDHIEGLYSSFLKLDREGRLEYEHLSAKAYVEEICDENKRLFSSEESHRTMADIAICAIEQPSNPVWTNAGIDLVGQGPTPKASVPSADAPVSEWNTRHSFSLPSRDPLPHFGQYLFRYWLQHCQILSGTSHFIQRMSDFFRQAHPGFEGWVIYYAEKIDPFYRRTLTRLAGEEGGTIRPSPFLCMVAFGFSPGGSLGAGASDLQDLTVRNLKQQTALHIACKASDLIMVEDLFKLMCSDHSINCALLSMMDHKGNLPYHLARNCSVFHKLLDHETHVHLQRFYPSRFLHVMNNQHIMAVQNTKNMVGGEQLLKAIIDEGCLAPPGLDDLCRDAIWERDLGTLKVLFQHEADLDRNLVCRDSSSLFHRKTNDTLLVKFLFHHRAKFEGCEELADAFDRAARDFNLEMLDILHDRGVPMDTDRRISGLTAQLRTVTRRLLSDIEILRAQGALEPTVLHIAAGMGNIEMAGLLLDHGADVNLSGSHRYSDRGVSLTLLASAVSRGNREMARFLVGRGADATLLDTSTREELSNMLQI